MNKFRNFSLVFILTLMFSAASFGQAAQTTGNKIVIIDTSAFFSDKVGITKIINASKQLDTELAPKRNELQQMATRSQSLEREIENLQKSVQNKVPIDEKSANAKVDELEKIRREGKFKQDEYNSMAKTRQEQVLGPIYAEAMKALGDFIKTKGYGMVFDVSKDQSGMLIFAAEAYDITKDFVAFYNARPASAAAPSNTPANRPATRP